MLITKHLSFTLILSISLTFLFASSAKARDYAYQDDSDYFGFENGGAEISSQSAVSSDPASKFYLGGKLGWSNNTDLDKTKGDSFKFKANYPSSLIGGRAFSDRFILELEALYTNIPVKETDPKKYLNIKSILFNIVYQQSFSPKLRPNISLGVGPIWKSIDRVISKVSSLGLAVQGQLGLEYAVTENLAINVGFQAFTEFSKPFSITETIPPWADYNTNLKDFINQLSYDCEIDNPVRGNFINAADLMIESKNLLDDDQLQNLISAYTNYFNTSIFSNNNTEKITEIAKYVLDRNADNEYNQITFGSALIKANDSANALKASYFNLQNPSSSTDMNQLLDEASENYRKFRDLSSTAALEGDKLAERATKSHEEKFSVPTQILSMGPRISLIYKFNF